MILFDIGLEINAYQVSQSSKVTELNSEEEFPDAEPCNKRSSLRWVPPCEAWVRIISTSLSLVPSNERTSFFFPVHLPDPHSTRQYKDSC